MDWYIFKDLDKSEYSILAPNLWQKHFKMSELHEIMRERESKVFAEILNRLREGNHTIDDIMKLKERIFDEKSELKVTDNFFGCRSQNVSYARHFRWNHE